MPAIQGCCQLCLPAGPSVLVAQHLLPSDLVWWRRALRPLHGGSRRSVAGLKMSEPEAQATGSFWRRQSAQPLMVKKDGLVPG